MRSNCILESIREYKRLRRAWVAGGSVPGREPYIWTRGSRLAPPWIPHVGVAHRPDGAWVLRSFKPLDTRALRWYCVVTALYYAGHWVEGDD